MGPNHFLLIAADLRNPLAPPCRNSCLRIIFCVFPIIVKRLFESIIFCVLPIRCRQPQPPMFSRSGATRGASKSWHCLSLLFIEAELNVPSPFSHQPKLYLFSLCVSYMHNFKSCYMLRRDARLAVTSKSFFAHCSRFAQSPRTAMPKQLPENNILCFSHYRKTAVRKYNILCSSHAIIFESIIFCVKRP